MINVSCFKPPSSQLLVQLPEDGSVLCLLDQGHFLVMAPRCPLEGPVSAHWPWTFKCFPVFSCFDALVSNYIVTLTSWVIFYNLKSKASPCWKNIHKDSKKKKKKPFSAPMASPWGRMGLSCFLTEQLLQPAEFSFLCKPGNRSGSRRKTRKTASFDCSSSREF